ncbi:extracellular solute-binding protein [Streptomyces inhibens]|uniref:Sugar binding protein MppD n=1 Tax=Streptomyces hygroscopicus TaxID=1912 RepID=Q643D4_STRHY|nr:extracellular solute-binding protein [Streptomyces inhibens]AAU34195.1 sugar binding protein MppD [Streptomyces hygroscopicus]
MRRRTFTAGAAAGAALLAGAGCDAPGGAGHGDGEHGDGDGGDGRGSGGRRGAPVTLTVLTHYASEPLASALQTVVDAWNATHRRITVRTAAVKFPDLLTTYMVRQAAGQGADIIHPYCLWTGQLVRAGVLRPVPPTATRQIRRDFTPAAVAASSVHGTLYGYPTEVQTYALYYNKRLLRQAGIDGPPGTWQELEDAAYRTARRDRHGNMLVQGFGLSRADDASVVGQTLALLAARGGTFLTSDGRRTAIGSAAGRDVLDLERRLIDRGAADSGISLLRAFPSGQVAMAINAGWWTASLRGAMGADYREVGVAPVPGPAPDDRGTLATGFLLGVNAKSRYPGEAWEFLHWLNGVRAPAARPGRSAGGGVPVSRMSALQVSVGSMTGRADDMRALLGGDGERDADGRGGGDRNLGPFLDALRYAVPEPNGPRAQQAKSLLRKNIEDVWTGRASVDAALRTAGRQIDQELSRPY